MSDIGNIFNGLTFDEGDLGDGEYGATKKKWKLFGGKKKRKARQKVRKTRRETRRADRKAVLSSKGMSLQERHLALKKARVARRAAAKAGRGQVKAGKVSRKSLPQTCSTEGKILVKRIGRKKIQFVCYQGRLVPLKSLPPAVSKALLKQARQKKVQRKAEGLSLKTGLPQTSGDAFTAAQEAAAYSTEAASAYTAATDMYQPAASYQEEAYQAEAYDAGQGYAPDSSSYWEGGGGTTDVSSYAPAAAEGYAEEELEEEGSSKLPLILGGVAVLALGGVGFYVYKKKKSEAGEPEFPEFPETEEEGA